MDMNIVRWIDQRKHWWKVFMVIMAVSVAVVGYIGYNTYKFAPPLCDFVDENGNVVFSRANIEDGQLAFKRNCLMDYGSYLGDGGLRGPDYTAEALHLTTLYMIEHYDQQEQAAIPDREKRQTVVEALVQKELKQICSRSTIRNSTAAAN